MADIMQLDSLSLYMGDPYIINEHITIKQPKVGQIAQHGEQQYYSMITTLTATPSQIKSTVTDWGLDYEKVSDFELFTMIAPSLNQEQTAIILGDVNLAKLRPFRNPQNDQIVLVDRETGLMIDTLIYERIVGYLRKVHGLKKIVEYAHNKYTKQILIDEDRRNIELSKNKPYQSFLLPLVSAVKVRMGYTMDYVKNMGIFEIMDDVQRLQIIQNADALLHGMYGGMIDSKNIKKEDINWLKELKHD